MELWFWAAVGGAVLAGFSNFAFKIAAKRSYNAELFTLIGGLSSVVAASCYVWLQQESLRDHLFLGLLTMLAGAIAACGGVMKVYALRYIDATIFFPLFKLLSPLLALALGIVFFGETHSTTEWLGLLLGLSVPLLLINRLENGRQTHLSLGLCLVVLVALTSSAAAAMNKFVIDLSMPVAVVLWYASVGVAGGTIIVMVVKVKANYKKLLALHDISGSLIMYAIARALLISASLLLILYAYIDGTLGVVQTIHSMYILIPIVLSIVFYNEHWNLQKAIAIVLSVAALALLG